MGLEELSEAFRKQLYIREYVKTLESKIVECDGESDVVYVEADEVGIWLCYMACQRTRGLLGLAHRIKIKERELRS